MGKKLVKPVKKEDQELDIEYSNFFHRLKNSFLLIKNNKLLFSLLCILTFVYIATSVFLLFYYTTDVFENQKVVIDYLSNVSESQIISGDLGPEPLIVYNHMLLWKKAFYTLIFTLSSSVLIFGIILWGIVNFMKRKLTFRNFLLNYFVVQLVYFIPFILIFYFSFNQYFENALGGETSAYVTLLSWIALFIIGYLYFISLGLTTNSILRDIFRKTFRLSIKPLIVLPTYLLSLSLIIGSFYLIYLFNEIYDNFYLLGTSLILFFIVFAYTKILFAEEFV